MVPALQEPQPLSSAFSLDSLHADIIRLLVERFHPRPRLLVLSVLSKRFRRLCLASVDRLSGAALNDEQTVAAFRLLSRLTSLSLRDPVKTPQQLRSPTNSVILVAREIYDKPELLAVRLAGYTKVALHLRCIHSYRNTHAAIAHLPSDVTSLRTDFCNPNATAMEHLTQLRTLKCRNPLDISSPITAAWSQLTNLTSMRVAKFPATNQLFKVDFPYLLTLRLPGVTFFQATQFLPHITNLTSLGISISDSCIEHLEYQAPLLRRIKELHVLDALGPTAEREVLYKLLNLVSLVATEFTKSVSYDFARLTNVTELTLHRTQCSGIRQPLPRLRTITFKQLIRGQLSVVTNCLRKYCTGLRKIRIPGKLSDDDISIIAAAADKCGIPCLKVSWQYWRTPPNWRLYKWVQVHSMYCWDD